MPTIAEYQEIKATKLAQALHAGAITAAQAIGFDESQWNLASQAANVRPPKTSIALAIQKLRDLEEQDHALAVARAFFYEDPEPVGVVCSNCGLGADQALRESDVPCCDGKAYCLLCGDEHLDDRRDGQICLDCEGRR